MAGPRVSRSFVLYCVAFAAAATASRADGIVYEKIPLGAIFEQGSDEVQTAFKLAVFKHNQNNTERRFELQAYVDVIKTADAFKLSKLSFSDVTAKRPANGINAVTKRKTRADRSTVKKRVWNVPWTKKETSGNTTGGGGNSSDSGGGGARPSTVTLPKSNRRPLWKSGRAALAAEEALAESADGRDDAAAAAAAVTTCAVTANRFERQTVDRSQALPRETSATTTTTTTTLPDVTPKSDRAATVTAALAESADGDGGRAAVTAPGLVTVTQVEQQTVNRSQTLPCKTFTQQTVPHIDHSARAPVPKSSTRWSCIPSHRTHPPRWMTTDHHVPITLPTCRPFTSVFNPATRWFLKMTTVMNRWSRKSKATKSRSPR